MKDIYLFFSLFFISFIVQGQCPEGDVTFTTQEDVDAFVASYGTCELIQGNLVFNSVETGNPIVDLTGLTNLTTVLGVLDVQSLGYIDSETNDTISVSLEGLENIRLNWSLRPNRLCRSVVNLFCIHEHSSPTSKHLNQMDIEYKHAIRRYTAAWAAAVGQF